ncbi:MAG: SpaA isopeptide-forming pilin-related protein [Olsenella sp.]|jgi:LPXTG-motif cell wall-anchored protein
MKHLGKGLSAALVAVLAVVMALALAPTAALAATHTITINDQEGKPSNHDFAAYEVFSGTYDSSTSQLTGIAWGSGVNGDELLQALKADTTVGDFFKEATDAPTAAAAMADINDADQVEALAKVIGDHLGTVSATSTSGVIEVPDDGYYFVKDTTSEDNIPDGETYFRYILKVAGEDVTVSSKNEVTTSNKYVKETNDSEKDTTEELAGWQSVADYDMGDQVPFQLVGQIAADYGDYDSYYFEFDDTYDKDQLGKAEDVKVFVGDVQLSESQLTAAGYKLTQSEGSFTIAFTDLKKVVGADGKPLVHPGDSISVEYTAELLTGANIGAAGNVNTSHTVFSNNPNNKDSKGRTPDHTTKVFTYQLVINKVNEANKHLLGADFTLYKLDREDGTYKEVPIKVDNVDLKTVSDDGATFTFKGLDEGKYKIVESTTPKGYNKISDIEFEVSSTTDDDAQELTGLSGKALDGTAQFAANTTDGSVTTDIQNKSGSVLPSTGGMGTTVLYVGGAALAIVAVVGLVRRRATRNDA